MWPLKSLKSWSLGYDKRSYNSTKTEHILVLEIHKIFQAIFTSTKNLNM